MAPIVGVQCWIARTALGWNLRQLGRAAEVSAHTVKRFECGYSVRAATVALIQNTLESSCSSMRTTADWARLWALSVGFGVEVVLLASRIRTGILGRHQPSTMAVRSDGRRCMPPSQRGMALDWRAAPRPDRGTTSIAPFFSRPTTWTEFLPMSMPITAISAVAVLVIGALP